MTVDVDALAAAIAVAVGEVMNTAPESVVEDLDEPGVARRDRDALDYDLLADRLERAGQLVDADQLVTVRQFLDRLGLWHQRSQSMTIAVRKLAEAEGVTAVPILPAYADQRSEGRMAGAAARPSSTRTDREEDRPRSGFLLGSVVATDASVDAVVDEISTISVDPRTTCSTRRRTRAILSHPGWNPARSDAP